MLSDYLESVREIERRVQKMEANDLSHIALPDAPVGIPSSFDEQMNLMFDTVALAWTANLTRVTSFMMAAEVSNMTYNHVEVGDGEDLGSSGSFDLHGSHGPMVPPVVGSRPCRCARSGPRASRSANSASAP